MVMQETITIFKDLFDQEPHYITVEKALERIKTGRSKDRVLEIRAAIDKERSDSMKKTLPSVCFSGKFKERKDNMLEKHSGLIVLDFDGVLDTQGAKAKMSANQFVLACWVSPSGNGIKALVRIADGSKHREHFEAIRELWPDIDPSGKNEARVCFESYDPDIYINPNSSVWTQTVKTTQITVTEQASFNQSFENILRWLTNRNDAFVSGNRNTFIFKLASACCRFGIPLSQAEEQMTARFGLSSDFTISEMRSAIKSAYARNQFASAVFERDILVDTKTRSEVQIHHEEEVYNKDIRAKDVIYGEDVYGEAIGIYRAGYPNVPALGHPIDKHYKKRRGELTTVTGYANLGKTTFWTWYLTCRAIAFDEKFGIFSPENTPAEEFYHDIVEMILGCDMTPKNPNKPTEAEYKMAYDFVSKHFFYIYPETIAPTPDYIKERFLSLIIKEGIDGCVIDPFNQLANDYSKHGGRSDKYLETFLSDCSRFAQQNNVYFDIVAHPRTPRKKLDQKDYDCPEVFDIADGVMWVNKSDNILVFHRPFKWSDPYSTICELHAKKIRRQKIVGETGVIELEYSRASRRFIFDGKDFFSDVKWGDKKYGTFVNETLKQIQPNTSFISSQEIKEARDDEDWSIVEEAPF